MGFNWLNAAIWSIHMRKHIRFYRSDDGKTLSLVDVYESRALKISPNLAKHRSNCLQILIRYDNIITYYFIIFLKAAVYKDLI